MFTTVLIANRGEIACRIILTLRQLGIRSVAIYSDADADARHVTLADTAVRIGPAAAAQSYLNIPAVIAAATQTGAQAIHPGYGFLAENAGFAQACQDAGLVFIGPTAAAIEVMGDKISAKTAVASRGVPTVPGIAKPGLSDADLRNAAPQIGYPLLIKPSAGGGGKGMHVVTAASDLPGAIAAARREAAASFGDDALFLERYLLTPRHIEVQVLADAHGNVIHLGERECSLQRRHQKVIEEAPSPLLDEATRAAIGAAACETARSVAYRGAGTVEFIVEASQPDQFFFMEMNTRLQVEHPVTEQITGVDLVEQQLRIAAGEPLTLSQEQIVLRGHSIEARVYAEDPAAGFLPTGGLVAQVSHPTGAGVRVDTAIASGLQVAVDYDPMLAKIITWGEDRETARRRLVRALDDTVLLGFATNVEFMRLLLELPEVVAGELDTGLIGRVQDTLSYAAAGTREFAEAAVLFDRAGQLRDRAGQLGDRAGQLRDPAGQLRDPAGQLGTIASRETLVGKMGGAAAGAAGDGAAGARDGIHTLGNDSAGLGSGGGGSTELGSGGGSVGVGGFGSDGSGSDEFGSGGFGSGSFAAGGHVTGPWTRHDGWRLGDPAPRRYTLQCGEQQHAVRVIGEAPALTVDVAPMPGGKAAQTPEAGVGLADGGPAGSSGTETSAVGSRQADTSAVGSGRTGTTTQHGQEPVQSASDPHTPQLTSVVLHSLDGDRYRSTVAGITRTITARVAGDRVMLAAEGATFEFRRARASHTGAAETSSDPRLESPMPGTVVLVHAQNGIHVNPGDPVLVVEAMKMEHVLRATVAGTVTLHASAGDQVARGQTLAVIQVDTGTAGTEEAS